VPRLGSAYRAFDTPSSLAAWGTERAQLYKVLGSIERPGRVSFQAVDHEGEDDGKEQPGEIARSLGRYAVLNTRFLIIQPTVNSVLELVDEHEG